MKHLSFFQHVSTLIFFLSAYQLSAQTNILSTNAVAEQVMLGNYDPAAYTPSVIINHPDSVINGIITRINADSLLNDLVMLTSFKNRNSGSDTISSVKGIGAARRWVYSKFQQFSNQNNHRLIASYLQFDRSICGASQHKCPFAVLPGIDTTDPSIIIIESHLDSRCEGLCDTACVANGADDNGSGTALVIECARVLSHYCFKHTIVFLTNIAEEQGLYGAEAFADYVDNKGIRIKAVQNNDIVGGILCGHSSSPPSCPGFGDIDSTQIRLFSFGSYDSEHKGFVRFIKLEYKENIRPTASVPMTLSIMTAEDRTGRGGDHQPFRQHGWTAMRFTSANENGNANVSDTAYHDNQHTSRDVLGYDTNGDGAIDSFLVDKDYLKRNTQINANAAAMAAIGVKSPDYYYALDGNDLQITITDQTQYLHYRVGIRTSSYDFDSVYTMNGTSGTIHLDSSGIYYVSVASVDSNNIESFFSHEQTIMTTGIRQISFSAGTDLLPMKPNPADDATTIVIYSENENDMNASIRISDSNGIMISEIPVTLHKGLNEIPYRHKVHETGVNIIQLLVDGKVIASRNIVFTR